VAERLSILYWRRQFKRRVSPRRRAALRNVWEGALNGAPDRPFLIARRRYERRLANSGSARPSVLLRLAAFRKRIPPSMQNFALLGRPDLKMANVDSAIDSIGTRVVFWTGDHWVSQRGAGMAIWEKLCRRAKRIVELGANVGYYTIAGGAAASGEYTAYEPHPRSCAALRSNLELNGLRQVSVVEAAAVPEATTSSVELVCSTGHDRGTPSGAMVRGSAPESSDGDRANESLMVDAVPFGTAITGSDLVKIDVEGLEVQLFLSAWAQLTHLRPVVMVEVHTYNRALRSLIPELMRDLDAAVYAMRRDHLVPVGEVVWQGGSLEAFHTWDFLIVPSCRASFIDGLVKGP
jgi:FkbM family methyltransferase